MKTIESALLKDIIDFTNPEKQKIMVNYVIKFLSSRLNFIARWKDEPEDRPVFITAGIIIVLMIVFVLFGNK